MALTEIKMENLNRISFLLVGPPGIGKTSLIKSIPPEEGVIVLAADPGLLSVRDLFKNTKIKAFAINGFEDLKSVYDYIQLPEVKKEYNWLYIDGLTEISDKCVDDMKRKFPNKADSFNLWNSYADLMTSVIKTYRDASDYNVVMTALRVFTVDDMNRRSFQPDVAGTKLKNRLESWFDEVFYFDRFPVENSEVPKRLILTGYFNNFKSKDRSGKLDLFEPADLNLIRNKILGKEPKPEQKPEPKK